VVELSSIEEALRQREDALRQREEEANQKAKYPPPSSTSNPINGIPLQSQPSSSHASSPTPASTLAPLGSESGNFLGNLDFDSVPPELKKGGRDWFALFNPQVKRVLDVSLMYTLVHERYVPDEVKIGFY
jgi:hypothetical protein